MDNQKETEHGEVLLPRQLDDDVLRYVMECAGLNNPDGARLVKAVHHFMYEALRTKPELQLRPDDFARIVRASNGQQVLFVKDIDPDEGNVLRCEAQFDNYQGTFKMAGIPDAQFSGIFGLSCKDMADGVLAQIGGFFGNKEPA